MIRKKSVHFNFLVDVVYLPEKPIDFEQMKILLWYTSKDMARFLHESQLERIRKKMPMNLLN